MYDRIIIFLLCILVSIGMCGCHERNKTDIIYIKLSSNPSAHMNWEYDVSEEGIIDITKEYDLGNCPKDADGCAGGYNIYTIKPIKTGEVTIKFKYIYGGNNTITKTAIYKIVVSDDNKITEEHFGTYFEDN